MLSSFFVALVINPGLTSALMKVEEDPINKRKLTLYSSIAIVVGILIAYVAGAMAWENLCSFTAVDLQLSMRTWLFRQLRGSKESATCPREWL